MNKFFAIALLVVVLALVACAAPATQAPAPTTAAPAQPTAAPAQPTQPPAAAPVTLTIESWRNDDLKIWQDQIIPAFEKSNPGIKVVFQPTAPTEYNAALNTKLQGGTAGDLITCRPFDNSLQLYQQGYLAKLNDLKGMSDFSDVAKSAWITDDGKDVFCVPMASVIHGFIYNQEAFDKLGLKPPTTQAEFQQVLDAIKKDGTYTPLVMGTADQWESATMGFQNIGPNNWKGEEGRLALIKGTQKFTDPPYIETWSELAKWKDYLPPGYEAIKYSDAQSYFALGKGAIYPAGSWDISTFNDQAKFKFSAFKPPVANAGDTCYISDHTDIALGMNSKTKNADAAKTFLEWVASPEFASIYSNALPGFFTLQNTKVELKDPVAQEFVSWRGQCKSTIRNSYQILSRGDPNLENELWRLTAGVVNGTITPQDAGQQAQAGLDKWYKPQ